MAELITYPLTMLIQANALRIPLTDQSVDMVFADPPYGITENEWDRPLDLRVFWQEIRRVTKPNAAVCITAVQPFSSEVVTSNRAEFRYEWVFAKTRGTGHLNANRMPLRAHDSVLVFYRRQSTYNPQMTLGLPASSKTARGGKSANYGDYNKVPAWFTGGPRMPLSVVTVKSAENGTVIHPTQKPVALVGYLIRTYTNPGDLVLDPTVGSGTTLAAAAMLERRAIGIDLSMPYLRLAQERNRQMTLWEREV